MAVIGLTGRPINAVISGLLGFPVALLVTTLISVVAVKVAETRLTSDRIAFLGGVCGFLTGGLSILARIAAGPGLEIRWNLNFVLSFGFILLLYGGAGAVGGWVGSMSWTEPGERARLRRKVARLYRRRPRQMKRRSASK